jgi:hypothetical protein
MDEADAERLINRRPEAYVIGRVKKRSEKPIEVQL